jgi:hypothetical protein
MLHLAGARIRRVWEAKYVRLSEKIIWLMKNTSVVFSHG